MSEGKKKKVFIANWSAFWVFIFYLFKSYIFIGEKSTLIFLLLLSRHVPSVVSLSADAFFL